ncbi:P1 family peptidase [Arthrobacter mobilis]|uniref:P1 family peptidase n=1 Tax=Arthrobacter mobilis TaxID=2724944 RepID=A0A7X6K3J5_9MICC|nr:P1 family peptidase [Arthrobacter mobilis]NKX53590.1 P1 family peptidase [Arthrobacter mobilis]
MTSSITDVPGIRVGQVERTGGGWLSGVTVVLPPPDTVGSVDVRGGGPATHETDALDPTTLVRTVDAVVLTGGSAFGLASASGVQRWCEEQGRGFRTPNALVPIVPAAAIYDLGRGGDVRARPDARMGYDAAAAAGACADFAPLRRGNAGAGTGAAVDFGRFKGGVGSASLRMDGTNAGIVVGALAVVNAAGRPAGSPGPARPAEAGGPPLNTTLCVVATNAVLDPAEAKRTASAAHAGLARALDPSHTLVDGDVVFCLATCSQPLAGGGALDPRWQLQVLAAEAVRLAILDGVGSAEAVETPGAGLAKYPDLT